MDSIGRGQATTPGYQIAVARDKKTPHLLNVEADVTM
jgi:hypothetical protein